MSHSPLLPVPDRTSARQRCLLGCLLLASLFVGSGCEESAAVREYSVANPPQAGIHWSYKLVGPADAVGQQVETFKSFVESTTYNAKTGLPEWTLPEGWTEEETASSLRYRTLKLPGTPPLEVAVIQVSGQVPASREESRQQANMFRSQVGLKTVGDDTHAAASEPPIASTSTAESDEVVDLGTSISAGNFPGKLYDFTGESNANQQRVLAAIVPVPISPQMAAASAETPKIPFTFDQPEGWAAAPQTTFSVVSLTTGGDKPASFTVTPSQGGLLPNVNRWRGQVGLDTLADQEALLKEAEAIETNGAQIAYVRAVGETRAILGGILVTRQGLWFFKLDGVPDSVQDAEGQFRSVLESIKLVN
ncbi:MAG: hypothetical protein R3B90_21550 [Planctomycetaceae bacterium]